MRSEWTSICGLGYCTAYIARGQINEEEENVEEEEIAASASGRRGGVVRESGVRWMIICFICGAVFN